MKIAILGDTHFGARNRNVVIEAWQKRFYEEVFWPYIDKEKIQHVIQVGDWFDSRKWLNIQTLAFQKEMMVTPIQKRDMRLDVIVGNHDIPFKHSLKNNSPQQVIGKEQNVNVYETIESFDIEDCKITLMPWVCKDNYEESFETIRGGGDILIGHYDVQGALMFPGHYSRDGFDLFDFKDWNKVISGHYHTQSITENFTYTGTPYELMWSDSGGRHGFWVLDTATKELEFIKNPLGYHIKLIYANNSEPTDLEGEDLKNTYVKLYVKEKESFENFERYIDAINLKEPFELKIIESFEQFNADNVEDIIELSETTDLISEYIDDVATDINKKQIKQIMIEIYEEAKEADDNL